MIAELASGIYDFFADFFTKLLSFLASCFSGLFEGIKSLLVFLFEPLLILIATIFYFLYKLGLLIIAVFKFLYSLVVIMFSVMKGLFVTLIGLTYNGTKVNLPPRYQEVVDNMQPAMELLQINKVAVICLWIVWIFVAVAIVRIVGARGSD